MKRLPFGEAKRYLQIPFCDSNSQYGVNLYLIPQTGVQYQSMEITCSIGTSACREGYNPITKMGISDPGDLLWHKPGSPEVRCRSFFSCFQAPAAVVYVKSLLLPQIQRLRNRILTIPSSCRNQRKSWTPTTHKYHHRPHYGSLQWKNGIECFDPTLWFCLQILINRLVTNSYHKLRKCSVLKLILM